MTGRPTSGQLVRSARHLGMPIVTPPDPKTSPGATTTQLAAPPRPPSRHGVPLEQPTAKASPLAGVITHRRGHTRPRLRAATTLRRGSVTASTTCGRSRRTSWYLPLHPGPRRNRPATTTGVTGNVFDPDPRQLQRHSQHHPHAPKKNRSRITHQDICPPPPGTYVLISMKTWLSSIRPLTTQTGTFVPPPSGHLSLPFDSGLRSSIRLPKLLPWPPSPLPSPLFTTRGLTMTQQDPW